MGATQLQSLDKPLRRRDIPVPVPAPEPIPPSWAKPRKRWVLPVVAVAGLAVLGIGLREILSDAARVDESLVFYTVRRGTLPIVVTERGNLESQQTEQIMCEVENLGGDRSGMTGTQILFIVPNGSSVKQGDLLVELDSAPLKERLDAQFLSLQRAEAEMIQANSKYENQITQNETNLADAQLAVELAEIDLESYEDEAGGTFQIELQNVEMEIQKARAEQMIAKSDQEAVKLLYDLGYKNKGDLAAARLALLKADASLASQLARGRQLQDYTYKTQMLERRGRLDTTQRNLEQVKLNNEADLAQAKAAKESADRAYSKEKERYERFHEQLAKCRIEAPQDGMVAYSVGDPRRGGTMIEEGAFVRERQEIMSLPNLSRMQVNTAIHESVLDQVRAGLRAVIRVDAFPDRSYTGTVKTVAVLPDQGGWLSSDTKVYKTIVTIDQDVSQLKPGMTAVVEIDIEQLVDVLSVPIQAIVQRGNKNWCYVRANNQVVRRELKLGKTNDKFVEIREGLQKGDTVVLNPMSLIEEHTTGGAQKKSNAEDGEEGAAVDSSSQQEDPAMTRSTLPDPGSNGERPAADTGVGLGGSDPAASAADSAPDSAGRPGSGQRGKKEGRPRGEGAGRGQEPGSGQQ